MTNLYLIRHGRSKDNEARILNGHREDELIEKGVKQAQAAAKELSDKGIDVIYSSPLKRASQTAEIIREELGFDKVIYEPDLMERDFGVLTGKKIDEVDDYVSKRLQGDNINYFLDGEGVETFPELYARAQQVLLKLKREQPGKNVVVVTHGDIGMMMQAIIKNWTWQEGLQAPFWKNGQITNLKI